MKSLDSFISHLVQHSKEGMGERKTLALVFLDLVSGLCLNRRNSIPPMKGCNTLGISTPSFLRVLQTVLSVAVKVEFSI